MSYDRCMSFSSPLAGSMHGRSMVAVLLFAIPAQAIETVTFRYQATVSRRGSEPTKSQNVTLSGKSLHRDSQGGMIFEGNDGSLYVIPSDKVITTKSDDQPFEPLTHEELGEKLLADLPAGYRIHDTEHYVIAYDTSREYALWTSSLLERLYDALTRYWKKQGLELTEPRFPLPIVIHSSARSFQEACRSEGISAGTVGYYNLRTNLVRMFDLTGSEEFRSLSNGQRRTTRRDITRMLTMPIAEPLVATIVHEASHQVAFNTGLMHRLAKLPLWLVEGMAVYFEAPDANSSRGWRGIGKVNRRRLATFHGNLPNWNNSTLRNLIASDKVLRDPRSAGYAYADAWALNYYLIKRHEDQYVAYLKELTEGDPIEHLLRGPVSSEQEAKARVQLFEKHFGEINELQEKMLKMMSRL